MLNFGSFSIFYRVYPNDAAVWVELEGRDADFAVDTGLNILVIGMDAVIYYIPSISLAILARHL